ncbi:SUKH-4 family immunity protein [Glycomyces arizonensis]|uniref:SUKH-4 family immunity protein n=1 Tax=Glycomyces arizonensis TaxID=256035 RepID=UPI000410FDCB|nr:SUKH-4 family immunity protein [Glycomyces arizonensis]
MTDSDAYLRAWEPDNVIRFPRDQWMREFAAPAASYPEVDFLPIDMSAVYTSYLTGRFELYSTINLGGEETMRLKVIGAVPSDRENMLFCLDTKTGRVLLLGVAEGTLELVNATFKALTEFLYHFALFVDADTGAAGRSLRAKALRATLNAVDPGAFADRESWWSIALMQLEGNLR